MSAKHTPGPWTWGPRTDGNAEVFHDDGVLATAYGDDTDPQCWPVSANAQLLAAAPLLADALEEAEDVLSDIAKRDDCTDREQMALHDVRIALRLAGRLP